MVIVLATIAAVRQYRLRKQHKADLARLETYESALANLDLNNNNTSSSLPPTELAHLQQQALDATTARAAAACPTCGRANASRHHQRKCHRHQGRDRGRGGCGRNHAAEVAAVNAIHQVPAVAERGVETESGMHAADSKGADFSSATTSEKEMLAPYDDRYLQVPADVALPPYKN